MDNIAKTLAHRLANARIDQRLSQEALAEKAGITRGMIAKYETETSTPTIETLAKLATALDVTTDYLLGIEEKKPLPEKKVIATRVYTTDSMDTIAAHQTDPHDAPITESRLNEILKRAFDEYDKKRNQ